MSETDREKAAQDEREALVEDIDQTLEEALARELHPESVGDLPAGAGPGLPRRGSLQATGVARLLGTGYRLGLSGRLLVEAQGHQHAIDLDSGWVAAATTSDPERGLMALLVRQGRITEGDRDRVRIEALASGRRPGAIAVELGLLKSAELLPALRRQQEEIVLFALTLGEGTFGFDAEERAETGQLRLHRHPLALIRTGLARQPEGASDLAAPLGGDEVRLALAGGAGALHLLEQVTSGPGDRRLLALFDGVRPLHDIVKRSGQAPASALALTFALWAGGHLVPVDDPQRRRILRDRQLDRQRVLARAALAGNGDYFEVLGVSASASPREIASALGQLRADVRAAAGDPDLAVSLRAELDLVQQVTDEAARILGDPALRARYQEARPSPPAPARSSGPSSRSNGGTARGRARQQP